MFRTKKREGPGGSSEGSVDFNSKTPVSADQKLKDKINILKQEAADGGGGDPLIEEISIAEMLAMLLGGCDCISDDSDLY